MITACGLYLTQMQHMYAIIFLFTDEEALLVLIRICLVLQFEANHFQLIVVYGGSCLKFLVADDFRVTFDV